MNGDLARMNFGWMTRIPAFALALWLTSCAPAASPSSWRIDTTEEWQGQAAEKSNLEFRDGFAIPTGAEATFRSRIRTFNEKRSADRIEIEQSPVWENWDPIANLGPGELRDAPVLLSIGPGDYWLFGRLAGAGGNPAEAGYHAWQSHDMVSWEHRGPVTEGFSRWVTTAEYVDGKAYLYYDYPNDQDPHVYVDDNLTDGRPGENRGLAFADPSHGSDCAMIRDEYGRFHVIYEDWSPINAREHSWDSPLAGHAVSEDGLSDFTILAPVVDYRTRSTGKTGTYLHPHWKQHPDWDSNVAEYTIHEPDQDAFGDWAAIRVGGRYYLFCDFDPAGGEHLSVGRFTSKDIDGPFAWCGSVGQGHPDPDIAFAEGRFYLITQQPVDYVSPGPWVEQVEARVGVDTAGDGTIDHWTDWREVKETYDHTPGFAKHVQKTPAAIDLTDLPSGFGFQFELKLTDRTENDSRPVLDRVTVSFR